MLSSVFGFGVWSAAIARGPSAAVTRRRLDTAQVVTVIALR